MAITSFLALSSPSQTFASISSTFDSNAEGWTVVNWDWAGSGSSTAPTWTGGYIESTDRYGDGFWRAPEMFHGDLSAYYGQSISYEAMSLTTPNWFMSDIFVVSGNNAISFRFSQQPQTTSTHFSAQLNDTAGWMWGRQYTDTPPTAPLATAAQIQSILSNVTDILIREEYSYGADLSRLDNVVLTSPAPVPVPAAAWLFGSGLLGLVGLKRQRQA